MADTSQIKNRRKLKIANINIPPPNDQSWKIDGGAFIHERGNIVITDSGVTSGDIVGNQTPVRGDTAAPDQPAMERNPSEESVTSVTHEVKEDDIERIREIGRGNSSVVWVAKFRSTGKMVAVMVVNILERETRHQMLKEYEMLCRATCPFLVSFYGAFYREPFIQIVLEYVDAGSLQDCRERASRIPENVLACVTAQILAGLDYLHNRRQVHRDIKPSNLCLTQEGDVKLTDFGISAQLESTLQMCDTFVGTYNYMSPERIQGQEYSYSSDIWSLGIVLLECAMGQFPYPLTEVYIDLIQNIVQGPPDIPTHFSREFQDFLRGCLQSDPANRLSPTQLMEHKWLADSGDQTINKAVVKEWLASLPAASLSDIDSDAPTVPAMAEYKS